MAGRVARTNSGDAQKTAVEQTKAVFAPLKQRLDEAVTKLEDQIALAEEAGGSEGLENARKVLEEAKMSS